MKFPAQLLRPTTRSGSGGKTGALLQVSDGNKDRETVFVRLLPSQKSTKTQKTDAACCQSQKNGENYLSFDRFETILSAINTRISKNIYDVQKISITFEYTYIFS